MKHLQYIKYIFDILLQLFEFRHLCYVQWMLESPLGSLQIWTCPVS